MSKIILSASRIGLLAKCSFLYFARYVLHLPQESNSGSIRGGISHSIFEFLLKKRHKHHYDSIVRTGTIKASSAVWRLVQLYAKKEKLGELDNKGVHNLDLIDKMVVFGLSVDFFCEGQELEVGELEIKIDHPAYRVTGFIDKISKGTDGLRTLTDYKSSQSGTDDHSIQALTYSLWVKRVLKCDAVVKFLYLRAEDEEKFPDGPIKEYRFSDVELDGFEEYLKSLQVYLENFTEKDAKANMAVSKGYPKKEEGFAGRLMCGRASFPGEMKKDGSAPLYYCSAKFPFIYWVRVKNGKIIESSKDMLAPNEGEEVIEKTYPGCPAFN